MASPPQQEPKNNTLPPLTPIGSKGPPKPTAPSPDVPPPPTSFRPFRSPEEQPQPPPTDLHPIGGSEEEQRPPPKNLPPIDSLPPPAGFRLRASALPPLAPTAPPIESDSLTKSSANLDKPKKSKKSEKQSKAADDSEKADTIEDPPLKPIKKKDRPKKSRIRTSD